MKIRLLIGISGMQAGRQTNLICHHKNYILTFWHFLALRLYILIYTWLHKSFYYFIIYASFYIFDLVFAKRLWCSVASIGFQIKGFQMRDENTNDRKVEMLQNVSHFSYFLDRFILQTASFITIARSSIQNPWVHEPFIEIPRVCKNPC